MGFPKERYQAVHRIIALNKAPGTALSLKDAAATSLGVFSCPAGWGGMDILAMGFTFDTAGGAQTTAGTFSLQIAATDVKYSSAATNDNLGSVITGASVVSHAAWSNVETNLNRALGTANGLNGTAAQVVPAPVYPYATDGQKVELLVATQGVGAGDQTGYPYLLVRQRYASEGSAINN